MMSIVVTVILAWAFVSYFKVLRQSFFMLLARHCLVNYPVPGQILVYMMPWFVSFSSRPIHVVWSTFKCAPLFYDSCCKK